MKGQGQGLRGPPGTNRTGHGSHGGGAERREGRGGRGAPTAGRAAGAVHPPRHPTNAGALHPPPPPPPRPPLQHQPRRRRPHPPPTPPDPSTSQPPPPRRERSRHGWPLPQRRGGGARRRRRRHRGRRGSPRGGQRGPGPGTGTGTRSQTPLGGEALPLVVEVYRWLSWACSGTTRGMRNRPFDDVLLWRDGGNQEVPPGAWAAPDNHEGVLWLVIWAAWPDREPTCPAFLDGGGVLRSTDADANNWLPRALRNALTHWRYHRQNPPPPQPQPPHKRRRR